VEQAAAPAAGPASTTATAPESHTLSGNQQGAAVTGQEHAVAGG